MAVIIFDTMPTTRMQEWMNGTPLYSVQKRGTPTGSFCAVLILELVLSGELGKPHLKKPRGK
jgi:hypothetical protein